jgi:hypothetical protein
MKIYHNAQFLSRLKRFIFKNKGDWLNTLIGINLTESERGEIYIYPVYRSLRFVRISGFLLIEIPLGKKGLVVSIKKYRVEFFMLDAETLDVSDIGKNNQ